MQAASTRPPLECLVRWAVQAKRRLMVTHPGGALLYPASFSDIITRAGAWQWCGRGSSGLHAGDAIVMLLGVMQAWRWMACGTC